ncbi:MarR family winged helix-turn-helix transcriptional regulator [Phytoactinopolyspora limicola]|uniref:MarR family winged helix-turn-helix transcriptional regulator n=1 Tax=Phytoactinopolyspora limicola TaxID=2715536 RepID=UPI00140AD174|nr:MarR family transcriptional regulator [Phytoactinopolyspora limicola]
MSSAETRTPTRRFKVHVWRSLMEVHAGVLAELERELTTLHGLTLNEFDTLVNIPRDGIRPGELAHRVILSQSAVSRLVDRLERRGYVVREEAADDSRGVMVRVTPEGRAVLHPAIRTNATVVERAFADWLTPDELDVLDGAFARILARQLVS